MKNYLKYLSRISRGLTKLAGYPFDSGSGGGTYGGLSGNTGFNNALHRWYNTYKPVYSPLPNTIRKSDTPYNKVPNYDTWGVRLTPLPQPISPYPGKGSGSDPKMPFYPGKGSGSDPKMPYYPGNGSGSDPRMPYYPSPDINKRIGRMFDIIGEERRRIWGSYPEPIPSSITLPEDDSVQPGHTYPGGSTGSQNPSGFIGPTQNGTSSNNGIKVPNFMNRNSFNI